MRAGLDVKKPWIYLHFNLKAKNVKINRARKKGENEPMKQVCTVIFLPSYARSVRTQVQ
jgi:hypothetical protein